MNASASASIGTQSWQHQLDDFVGWIDAGRLNECLGGGLTEDLCAELAGNQRLKARLTRIVKDAYGLAPLPEGLECSDPDKAIILASPAALNQIALFAGAIWWSAAIANTVRASEVAALQAQIGSELSAFALKHRDLAGSEKSIRSFAEIADSIVESGWRCIDAWCNGLDPALNARVRLKLPADVFPDQPDDGGYNNSGAAIVRRAALKVLQ